MANPSSGIDEGARRPPLCAAAPLLGGLLPLVAGILLAKALPPHWAVAAGMAAAALIGAVRGRWPRDTFPPTRRLAVALALLAGVLLALHESGRPDPSWAQRPARETIVQLRVEERFNARKPGHIAGTATILRTRLPVDTVSGHPAAFHLESPPHAERPPARGEVIECRAVLEYIDALAERDDYQSYLLGRDIHLSLNRGRVLRMAAPPGRLEQLRQRLHAASQRALTSGSGDPASPGQVLGSMLLGNRALLSDERIDLYKRTGTFHLFAVSGLHVGSAALCLHLLAGLARLPRSWRLAPVLAGTWAYVWLTGASPSAVRAGIMLSCIGLAALARRQPHPFPALVLSAWLVLLWRPSQLFHLGFQLSYGVVAAILLVGLPMARQLRDGAGRRFPEQVGGGAVRRRARRFLLGSGDLACVSASASLASMPLIIQHFQLFTPGGTVVGILLNPLAVLAVMTGCLVLLAAPLAGIPLAGLLALAAWPGIRLMEWLLAACLRVPGAVDDRAWALPGFGTALLLAVLLAAWALQRLRMGGRALPAAALLAPHAIVLGALALGSVDA
jgi:competence protein ComEC